MRLAVGRERHRDAVHQHGRARRQAWIEATNAEIQRHVVAAGAVVVRSIDARNAIEHFTRRCRADPLELLAPNHITCAGMFENVGLLRGAQPVADHRGDPQLDRRASSTDRLQGEAVITVGHGLQAGAFEQGVEALLGRVLTFQTTAFQAAGDLRTI